MSIMIIRTIVITIVLVSWALPGRQALRGMLYCILSLNSHSDPKNRDHFSFLHVRKLRQLVQGHTTLSDTAGVQNQTQTHVCLF